MCGYDVLIGPGDDFRVIFVEPTNVSVQPSRALSSWAARVVSAASAGTRASRAAAAWLWSWLENQLAVLMKTLPLGQQAAQRLTSELLPLLQQAQQDASTIDPQHCGSAAFGLSLACMAHERQYSRLFRS